MNESSIRASRVRTSSFGSSHPSAPSATMSPRRARPPHLPVARIDTTGRWASTFQPMSFLSSSSSSESELDYGVDNPSSSAYSPTAATPVASSSVSSMASSALLRTPTSQDSRIGVGLEQRRERWSSRAEAELRTSIERLKANIKAAQIEMQETRLVLERRRNRMVAAFSPAEVAVLPSFSADSVYTESVAPSSATLSSVVSPSGSSLDYSSYSASSSDSLVGWR